MRVTFKGPFGYQPVALMGASGSAQARVSELTRGRADGEIAVTAENLGDASVDGEAVPVTLTDMLPPGLEAVGYLGGRTRSRSGVQSRCGRFRARWRRCPARSKVCLHRMTSSKYGSRCRVRPERLRRAKQTL